MADRNGYIGRAPSDSAVTVARQTFSPTGVTTDFTFASGYTVGYLDLFLNGTKLIEGVDYNATDTSTISLVSAAINGDVLEGVAYKAFNLGDASRIGIQSAGILVGNVNTLNFVGAGNSILLNGGTIDVSISGGSGGGSGVASTITVADESTDTTCFPVFATAATGDVEPKTGSNLAFNSSNGTLAATTFSGALTGNASSATVLAASRNIGGVAFNGSGDINLPGVNQSGTQNTSGTAAGLSGTPDITINNLVGVAATFTGVLTYEDVTNIDSLGIVTARTGINVLAGGINAVGVVTANSFAGYDYLQAPFNTTVTYTVTVATKDGTHRYPAGGGSSANGYKINGVFAPFLTLTPGRTYRFNQLDSSNNSHPIVFYKEADKTTVYSTGVVYNADGSRADAAAYDSNFNSASSTRYVEITVSDSTPVILHYQCYNHGYMGNAVNTNSNVAATQGGGGITTEAATPNNAVLALNLTAAQDHKVTASGITTITCSGGTEAESHTVRIINSGITTVGFSTFFLFPSGSAPVLPTASGAISLVSFTVNSVGAGGTQLLAGASLNFS